jgi:hypothetical protein
VIPLVKVRCAGDGSGRQSKCGALLGTVYRSPEGALLFERLQLEDRPHWASSASDAKHLPRASWTDTDSVEDPSTTEQHFALCGCEKHHNDHGSWTGGAEVGGSELWAKATTATTRRTYVTLMVHPQRCAVE